MTGVNPIETSVDTYLPIQDQQARRTVACLRCRDQKLKCDRALSSCERCRKQTAACLYPTPPDRKRIAQRTAKAKAALPGSGGQVRRSESPPSATTAPPAKRPRTIEEQYCEERPINSHDETETAELPSTELGLLLLEVYFKRVYNATLLFHKPIAFQLYMQGGIPHYLLRAMFAHAAVFLKEVDSPYQQYIKVLPMQTLSRKSWAWARSASIEALSHADEPSLVRVQALQVLNFYYFSQGENQRAIVHASLGYQLGRLLGHNRLYEEADSLTNRPIQFDREMKRRSFWASWCSFLIGSDQLDSTRVFETAANLPLV